MYKIKITPLLLFLLFILILVISVAFSNWFPIEGFYEGLDNNGNSSATSGNTYTGNVSVTSDTTYTGNVSVPVPVPVPVPAPEEVKEPSSHKDNNKPQKEVAPPTTPSEVTLPVTKLNELELPVTTQEKPLMVSQPTDSAISEYFKWYWYWKSNEQQQGVKDQQYLNNYMLKTQYVPPACPNCTACPNDGSVCSNCGGSGGCGTLSTTGSTLVNKKDKNNEKTTGNTYAKPGIISNTIDATGNVVTHTVDNAGNIVIKTIDAAGNIITKTIDTAGNIIGNVEDKVAGLFETNPTNVNGKNGRSNNRNKTPADPTEGPYGQGGANYRGTQISGADNYSYYGALPSKSGNFLPVTTDFSAFRK